jgi:hypothetical protein
MIATSNFHPGHSIGTIQFSALRKIDYFLLNKVRDTMEPIPIDLIGMVLERSMDLGTVFALMGVSKKANMHFKTLNKMWFKLCWKHFKLDGVAVSVARKKNSVSVFDIFRDCAVRGCWRTELGFNPGELFYWTLILMVEVVQFPLDSPYPICHNRISTCTKSVLLDLGMLKNILCVLRH